GAETAHLDAIRGTTDVEVDLVIAELFGDTRALGEVARMAAAELERNRMLGRIVGQEPRARAVKHRTGGDHLGVDQGAAREQAMEEPAVPIGPLHHRGDTEFSI